MNCVYGGGETYVKPQEAFVDTTSTTTMKMSLPFTEPPPNCILNQGGDLWSPNKECSSDCIIGFVKLEFPDFCCCYFIEEWNQRNFVLNNIYIYLLTRVNERINQ